jgi:cobalamin biosynthesis Mg chelatase CobN
MKKNFIFLITIFFTIAFMGSVKAQIKIHDDNHISLMSLTKGGGVQIQPSGYTYFTADLFGDWAWMNLTQAKQSNSKCWIVKNNATSIETFSVTGSGAVYYTTLLAISNPTKPVIKRNFENATKIISQLNGYYFMPENESVNYDSLYKELLENEFISKEAIDDLIADYYKKEIGLIAPEVEKILPDAIRTFSDGRKAIDYNALLVVLIEAFKVQQQEIDYLKKLIDKSENQGYIPVKSKSSNTNLMNTNSIETQQSVLYQNAPNPFNTLTLISYEINEEITRGATINIYDLNGSQIKSYPVFQGRSSIQISANELQAGIYFYSLIVNNREIDIKKMILTQ